MPLDSAKQNGTLSEGQSKKKELCRQGIVLVPRTHGMHSGCRAVAILQFQKGGPLRGQGKHRGST